MRPVTGLAFLFAIAALTLVGCVREEPSTPFKSVREPMIRQLTNNDQVFEANPIFSPDGNWILFESEVTGNRDLWLMPASGGEPTQLTVFQGFDSAPFWSPDGTKVVFESDRSGHRNIWILDAFASGTEPEPLTAGAWDDADPVYSPDGTRVVYESTRDNASGTDLWVTPLDGGSPVRLTTSGDGIYHRTVDWSPDGTRLVFESNRANNSSSLHTMPATGGEVTRLTSDLAYEGHPAWSPDGSQIAYESTSGGVMEVFIIPATGGTPIQATTEGGYWPRWSPDGRLIIFCVYGDPEPNIWTVEVDW